MHLLDAKLDSQKKCHLETQKKSSSFMVDYSPPIIFDENTSIRIYLKKKRIYSKPVFKHYRLWAGFIVLMR